MKEGNFDTSSSWKSFVLYILNAFRLYHHFIFYFLKYIFNILFWSNRTYNVIKSQFTQITWSQSWTKTRKLCTQDYVIKIKTWLQNVIQIFELEDLFELGKKGRNIQKNCLLWSLVDDGMGVSKLLNHHAQDSFSHCAKAHFLGGWRVFFFLVAPMN